MILQPPTTSVPWGKNRLLVRSCKTEAYRGKDVRFIPIFPELRPHLLAAFDLAPAGAQWVISKYRDPGCNLRTQFTRIIERAGLTPWPRLFHNLRSSRQTELAAAHPIHVVCAWLGNSAAVAQAHYLQVRDLDFDAAAIGTQATQKATQHAAAPGRKEAPATIPIVQNPADLREVAALCAALQNGGMTPAV